VNPPGMRT